MRKTILTTIALIMGSCFLAQAVDGTWKQAGNSPFPTYYWADSTNWTDEIIADGTNATAYFDTVDALSQWIDLGNTNWTVGYMKFTDTEPTAGFWGLKNGALNLAVSSGTPIIEISDAVRDVGIESTVTLTGDFKKTGAGQLYLKDFPAVSVNIEEGEVVYVGTGGSQLFTTQSISGAGDIRFTGQATGYFSFRPTYVGTLDYTGDTTVALSESANWFQGTLWLEKDDVLPHASLLHVTSGKIYMRNQTLNGVTVAGLTGNTGTFITTDRLQNQKLTVEVPMGNSYSYYGVIGADGTGYGNTNLLFIKTGAGTQTFVGTNTYAGGTVVAAGTLVGSVDGAFGSGNVTVSNGATLALANGVSNDYIGDQADLILNASSTLNLDFTGVADIISTLSLDGGATAVAPGTYTATDLSAVGGGTYTGTGSLTVTDGGDTPYEVWAGSWGVVLGDEGDDYDNDGVCNLYEYALGGDPTDAADQGTSPCCGVVCSGDASLFEYVHPQLHDPNSGLTYYLEVTDNLLFPAWTNAGYEVTGTNVTGGTLDFVTNVTSTVNQQKYIRLIIE